MSVEEPTNLNELATLFFWRQQRDVIKRVEQKLLQFLFVSDNSRVERHIFAHDAPLHGGKDRPLPTGQKLLSSLAVEANGEVLLVKTSKHVAAEKRARVAKHLAQLGIGVIFESFVEALYQLS